MADLPEGAKAALLKWPGDNPVYLDASTLGVVLPLWLKELAEAQEREPWFTLTPAGIAARAELLKETNDEN